MLLNNKLLLEEKRISEGKRRGREGEKKEGRLMESMRGEAGRGKRREG